MPADKYQRNLVYLLAPPAVSQRWSTECGGLLNVMRCCRPGDNKIDKAITLVGFILNSEKAK